MTRFCEVITEFNVEQFSVLERDMKLDGVMFITTDLTIKEKAKEKGYNVKWIDDLFGYSGEKYNRITTKAKNDLEKIKNALVEMELIDTKIVDGMKYYVLMNLIFLHEVGELVKEYEKIVFLLPNTEYYFFSIPEISSKLNNDSINRISIVQDGKIQQMKFNETKTSDSRFLYYDTQFLYENTDRQVEQGKQIEETLDKISINNKSKYAFFLNNNDADFYLKPVYPILEKFMVKNTNFIIFTLDELTTKQLLEKNYHPINLETVVNELQSYVLVKYQQNILDIINKIKNISEQNIIFQSYTNYIKNDAMARMIARIISYVLVLDRINQECNFESIVVGLDGTPNNDIVCGFAKKRRINTFSIMPTLLTENKNPLFGILFNAENLLLPGNRFREELEEMGINQERMIVIGSPRYDYVIQNKKLKKSNQVKNGTVLIAMSRWHKNDEEWMSKIIQFCNSNEFDVVIKIHPRYNSTEKQINEEKIQRISNICKGLKFSISKSTETNDIMTNASICITDHSTMGLEASLNNIDIIVANIQDEEYFKEKHHIQFHKEKIALYSETVEELISAIKQISFFPYKIFVKKQLKSARNKFNNELNYLNDGKASDRAYELITKNSKAT